MAAQAQVDVGGIARPQGRPDYSTALQPYRGTLGVRAAAHLLRRAGFGGTPDEVRRFAEMRAEEAASALVAVPSAKSIPAPPEGEIAGPTGMREARHNLAALQLWWLNRMLTTPAPLQEKMTLYFHGHFTSRATPRFPRITYNQNALFRSNATGNLRELTRDVSKDAAMLIYLDGANNVAAHPNENYARELMELFTLGVDNYSENDVRESARAWTGWKVNRKTDAVAFDPTRHDGGRKTLLGRTGYFDGDDVVNIIFDQPQCARFFAAGLLNWLVYNDPESELVDGVAELIRVHNYELAPVLSTILASNVFFSVRAYRALVKSPVEFVVGTHKALGLPAIDESALPALQQMGQRLFFPPSVAGWPGGANWLTSATMIARQNFLTRLLGSQTLEASSWLRGLPIAPKNVAASIAQTLLQDDVAPASLVELNGYLMGTGSAALASLSVENYDQRVRGAAYLALATPAYQLN
ncbi:MAG TPA: DUF1800 domain-containing protein [Candidatus Cybelea sp.]|jgi:uncharacterized protein (DUF1800 family)|nr:DUF1800 domain-containing protein [Candidatus Cybelea sp.]